MKKIKADLFVIPYLAGMKLLLEFALNVMMTTGGKSRGYTLI